jgi:hypothetical protein
MPITSTVDHDNLTINSVASGSVTCAHICDHLVQEKDLGILRNREFVDGREAVAMFAPAESRDIVDLLRKLSAQTPVGRKAILAPAGVAYGLTRVIEMLTEEFCDVRPFLDEQEARSWLTRV